MRKASTTLHGGLRGARRAGGVLVGVALVLAACSGREDPEEAAPPEEMAPEAPEDGITARGELYQTSAPVGTITMLSLEDDDGALRLIGELEEELRRLSGAHVEVHGQPAEAHPQEELRVESYEILEIDGQRPHVGTVGVEEDQLWLHHDGERSRLRGAPADLAEREGAKIWVTGAVERGEIRLGSYGVIRP